MLEIVYSKKASSGRGPAIFLDRDGVINVRRPGDYVLDWSQFEFVPGIQAALKQLSSLNLPMILVSNQAGVGKGLLDAAKLEEITRRMQKELLAGGVSLTAAFYCTHRADENCDCRKPQPGMLVRAAREFDIDLEHSIFIGDSASDVEAAFAAGCKPVLFGSTAIDARENSSAVNRVPVAHALSAGDLFSVCEKALKSDRGGN
jgi:histidinol-phosphate phosphatase family protein